MRTTTAAAIAAAAALCLALTGCGVQLTPSAGAAEPDAAAATPSQTETAEAYDPAALLDGIEPAADIADYVGASTATLADATVPVVADATPSLPVTVISHAPDGDEEVEITDASRVVAMDISGEIASTVWALGLGDTLVGRDTAAEFPGTEDLVDVTSSGHTVNVEAILALDPTLVLTDGSIGPRSAVAQLADAGVDVVFLDISEGYDGAADLARDVAAVFGDPAAGEVLASEITTQVEAVAEEVADLAPEEPLSIAFLYLRGSAGIYYMFGEGTGADAVIEALGGVDAAAEAGIEGEQPLTDEAMVAADPDVILVMTDGLESVGGIDGLLAERPAIALTSAGQHERIVDMDDRLILSFGPRAAAVLASLAIAVYAPDAS